MSAPARVLVDVTHTRTQARDAGIGRTVRRLLDALAAQGRCEPVAYGGGRFGLSDAGPPRVTQAAGLWQLQGAPGVRRLAAALPQPLVQALWQGASRIAFARPPGPAPGFGPGDWLLLADQCWNYPAWRGAAAARQDGARVALVVYDLIPLLQPQFCEPLFSRVFARWLPRMLGACDAVACISEATAQDLRQWAARAHVALPPLTHFRLGSDAVAAAGGQGAGARPALQAFFASAAPVFSMVGSIEPRKSHGEVLDLFERLWAQGLDCRLLVAGRAHALSRPTASRLAGHPEAGRRLLFLEDASDAELALAYDRSCALVFASRAEGFGLPVAEARTRGCPVIARALPCIREIADAGTQLFESTAQMEACLRGSLEQGRGRHPPMPAFSWDDSAAQLRERLGALLA